MDGQRRSELHEPTRIDRGRSTLQLHSIMSVISPTGPRGVPSRLLLSVKAPNSKKIADPCPRQTRVTSFPFKISMNGAATCKDGP